MWPLEAQPILKEGGGGVGVEREMERVTKRRAKVPPTADLYLTTSLKAQQQDQQPLWL